MPNRIPPAPPGAPVPGAPLAPLPISGRPSSSSVGVFTTASSCCSRACNGDAFAASAAAYDIAPEATACTNCEWKASTCALIAWYWAACAEKNAATLADTSSAAEATIPVVGAAAVALAVLIVDPIFAKSDAAPETISGTANTNDMHASQRVRRR